jgi:hypothetical protein
MMEKVVSCYVTGQIIYSTETVMVLVVPLILPENFLLTFKNPRPMVNLKAQVVATKKLCDLSSQCVLQR